MRHPHPIGARRIASARTLTLLALGAWLAAAVAGGAAGIVNDPRHGLPALAAFILIPIAGFVAAYALSPSFRAFTATLSLTWLVGAHLWRFVGLLFILLWFGGALPAGFAIPEGLGDVAAAAGALALLPGLRRGTARRGWLLAWNVFGFVDLVSALAMGILYSDTALGVLSAGTVTTEPMVTFPVSLIPTFFVPLFLLLHGLTFKRIAGLQPEPLLAAGLGGGAGVAFQRR